jgi:SAM-dependent methyltransferase
MNTEPLILPDTYRYYSDEAWFHHLLMSATNPIVNGHTFPGFPDKTIQETFVGGSYEETLQEAYNFYCFLKAWGVILGMPVKRDSNFLDFGCGWGRFLRFFWRDVELENLHGCDVSSMILDVCRNTRVPGNLSPIEPLGTLPYGDASIDAMMAYSVFTHLPKHVHLHWMKELARVAKPGAIFVLTLEPRRFITFVSQVKDDASNAWYRMLSAFAPNAPEYFRTFDAGEIAFIPTNNSDTYGDACVPASFIHKHWSEHFNVIQYLDDPSRFWQALLVVQRKG